MLEKEKLADQPQRFQQEYEIPITSGKLYLKPIVQEPAIFRQGGMQTQWAIDPLQDGNLPDSKRNQRFIIIADNMDGKRLKEFGLKLGLSSIDVGDIVDNSDERFAKCMNILGTWYSKFAPKVNWNNLLEASHTCKLANISEKLVKTFTADSKFHLKLYTRLNQT
ncbi:hypothetical protein TrispH2_008391 [Trichoplax sp. H2]|nr:hypothetical protein TrispH2_008391 [Trichoplax sp. H2]|eukprot:RDD39639.1 hypothetical protein TrispH2_008391 [Trichoplax sp. H2]